jgi:thymidylate synthase
MNNIDKQYTDLLQDILDNGVNKQTRNGEVLSVFGRQIRHDMKDGFPLLTTKKIHFKSVVSELLWFLQGRTDLRWLLEQGNTIWVGDAYQAYLKQFELNPNNFDSEELSKGHNDQCWGYPILDHVKTTSKEYKRGQINAYLEGKADKPFFYLTQEEFINKIKTDAEFAKKWGELGKIYGFQWRSWTNYTGDEIAPNGFEMWNEPIDQIANLISELKTNPDSRRLMVNAWNVGELDQMTLPPCHYGFQVYTRELSQEERWRIRYNYYPKDKQFPWDRMALPSHDFLDKFNIPRRAISLMWNQRSVDTFLGLPFNIASYGLLLEIIAKAVNMVPDELIGNLGDVHLYSNHIEQAKEQIGREMSFMERTNYGIDILGYDGLLDFGHTQNDDDDILYCLNTWGVPIRTREPYQLPKLNINTEFWPYEGGECGEGPLDAVKVFEAFKDDNFCKCLLEEDIQLGDYQSHPTIKAPLSN